ncbi:MAG: LacI family DNA-binding transcriptional regulator [Aggregatilineales bacterium]
MALTVYNDDKRRIKVEAMPEHSHKKEQRQVTIYDVARESGVSYSTVSRVLNGFAYVKETTRETVLSTAERLGYVANLKARSLAGGRSNVIGLLVPSLDNGYVGQIILGIDEELAKANYDLMLYTTHHRTGKESSYINAIANGLTDGLILVVPSIPNDYLDVLFNHRIPLVSIDRAENAKESTVVDATNRKGAYEIVSYLLELGHRRIGMITGFLDIASARERLESYRLALSDNDIPIDENLIVKGDFTEKSGFQCMNALLNLPLEQRPTAVFASNDLMALGAMEAIRSAGLGIPQDISVVGFDDIAQAAYTHPKLTTVRLPLDQMGRTAVQLLLEHIANPEQEPRHITLNTQIIMRESCRRISS